MDSFYLANSLFILQVYKYFKIFERNEVFYSLMKEGGEKDGI